MNNQKNTTAHFALVVVYVGNDYRRDGLEEEGENEQMLALGSTREEVVSAISVPVTEDLPVWAQEQLDCELRLAFETPDEMRDRLGRAEMWSRVISLSALSGRLSDLLDVETGKSLPEPELARVKAEKDMVDAELDELESFMDLTRPIFEDDDEDEDEHFSCFYFNTHSYFEVRRLDGDSSSLVQKLYPHGCGRVD